MTRNSRLKLSCLWLTFLVMIGFTEGNEDYFTACAEGDTPAVEKFLDSDPDLVNMLSDEGESCMMLAAIEDSVDMVKLLIKRGGDINERAVGEDNHRMPVLGWHILAGNHDVVDYLIAHGVDVNQEFDGVDKNGEMYGIFTALDLIDFLLEQIPQGKEDVDEEFKDMVDKYRMTAEILLENGAKKFVGSMEF